MGQRTQYDFSYCSATCFDYDFQGYRYTPKIWRNKRKRHKIINMQKLWRRDYNFNVNKDQLDIYYWLASTRIRYEMVIFYQSSLPMI